MFTNKEQEWIDKMDKLGRKKPKNICLYTTDGELTACKLGVPSQDALDSIRGLSINAGAVLTDMHDDMNNGRG